MSPLPILPVNQRRMLRHPVIPHHDSSLGPLDAGLKVRAVGQMIIKELEQGVGFFLFEADDFAGDWFYR